jgi:NAD(P)-dependent dehydrogenase (short-subunit alcohol dehydrogenase family)
MITTMAAPVTHNHCPRLLPVHELAAVTDTAAALSRHVWFEGRRPAPSSGTTSVAAKTRDAQFMHGCYACGKQRFRKRHGFYTSMCAQCGSEHYDLLVRGVREGTPTLAGFQALVVGGRTKIGYQVALRLLRTGARVVVTTRFPDRVVFAAEPDWAVWAARLVVATLDLNRPAAEVAAATHALAAAHLGSGLDALFFVAAQTIRGIERREPVAAVAANRYGDSKHFHGPVNSWALTLGSVTPEEVEEVMRVNTTGPFVVTQVVLPLIVASTHPRKCIVNTHAREGMFSLFKSPRHPHTNVAKAGLHMLTHMIQTTFGSEVPCFGIDPGWISLDEYGEDGVPLGGRLPLTELDGAAKLTDPVLAPRGRVPTRGTVRHYKYGTVPRY